MIANLTREKLRFFFLTLLSCLFTYANVHAGGYVYSAQLMPWSMRFANVPVAYARYLGKLVYPVHLAALYPMPDHWAWWVVGISVVVVLAITWFVLRYVRVAPYLFFGWFTFLGIIVPTLSLVAVGPQALADRYSYLSYIGLFVAGVWGICDLFGRWRYRTQFLGGLAAVSLLAFSTVAWSQIGLWRNNLTLWPYVLAVTTNNYAAENNLGCALQDAGKISEAIPHFLLAARLRPEFFDVNYNLGRAYLLTGQFNSATNYLNKANRITSDYADAHGSLGAAYFGLGDYADAEKECREAVRLDPSDYHSLICLGRTVSAVNRFDEATQFFSAARQLYPKYAEPYFYLGSEYLKRGLVEEAIANLSEAVRLDPSYPDAQMQLDRALSKRSTPKSSPAL